MKKSIFLNVTHGCIDDQKEMSCPFAVMSINTMLGDKKPREHNSKYFYPIVHCRASTTVKQIKVDVIAKSKFKAPAWCPLRTNFSVIVSKK